LKKVESIPRLDHDLGFQPYILVAEDNPVNQKVVLNILAKMGLKADAVENGLQALEALERKTYHLVLMDCQMPEMDGYQSASAIRKNKSILINSLPVVALTANAIEGERERCIDSGMNDFMTKPIQISELAQTLKKWLLTT
jgi:CheY-like chemotaxis protein